VELAPILEPPTKLTADFKNKIKTDLKKANERLEKANELLTNESSFNAYHNCSKQLLAIHGELLDDKRELKVMYNAEDSSRRADPKYKPKSVKYIDETIPVIEEKISEVDSKFKEIRRRYSEHHRGGKSKRRKSKRRKSKRRTTRRRKR
jgi:hypothetical protein